MDAGAHEEDRRGRRESRLAEGESEEATFYGDHRRLRTSIELSFVLLGRCLDQTLNLLGSRRDTASRPHRKSDRSSPETRPALEQLQSSAMD